LNSGNTAGTKPGEYLTRANAGPREWDGSVFAMYKHSTQKHRRFTLKKHLLPRFGDRAVCDLPARRFRRTRLISRRARYAPMGVDLPTLKNVRPKWALTVAEATALLTTCSQIVQRARGFLRS